MKVLIAPNEDFNRKQRTQLSAAAAAGSSVNLAVVNSAGFLVNDYVCIGEEGSETAELQQVTAVPDATHITVATLSLEHDSDDLVVKFRYNMRKFYGAMSSTGSFAEVVSSGSPVEIAVDDPDGTLLEYTGTDGFTYFVAIYFNSTTGELTDIAESTPVLADETTRYCSIYEIRKQAGMTENPYYDDGKVEAKRKQAENEVNSYILTRYTLPLTNSLAVSEIPFLVTRCTILLAAGYIAYEEYEDTTQGVKWLGEARGILNSIQKGGQRLIDSTGVEMATQQKTQTLRGELGGSYPDEMWIDGKQF